MPHFRVDDQLNNHPKARQAGLEAMGLWSVSGSYCMAYLTDGFVPEWYVKSWPKGPALAKRLVTARLWTPAVRDGENGWQFHEFTGPGRQDSRAEIEAEREKWRRKKAAQRGTSPQDSPVESPKVSPGDSPQDSRFPTQPIPNKEISCDVSSNATDPYGAGISATPGADLVRAVVPKGHPSATLTALRIQASELLRQGAEPDVVRAALQLWCDKPGVGIGRTILSSLYSEAIKTRAAPTAVSQQRPATSDLRVAQAQALKNTPPTRLELA